MIYTPNLNVHSIFYTIQGEGPYVGYPAVFVRLAGCNLRCPLCDTDYTLPEPNYMTAEAVVERILELAPHANLVVISGGEPFRQPVGLLNLLRALNTVELNANGFNDQSILNVQLETNGTMSIPEQLFGMTRYQGGFNNTHIVIVCCPKFPSHVLTARRKLELSEAYVDWKYTLDADHVNPADGLPSDVLGMGFEPVRPWHVDDREAIQVEDIYLQPVDTGDPVHNKRNIDACVASCMKYGYRLCLQTHKIAGLP